MEELASPLALQRGEGGCSRRSPLSRMLSECRTASRRVGTSARGASQAPENPRERVKTHRAALTPSHVAWLIFNLGKGALEQCQAEFPVGAPLFLFYYLNAEGMVNAFVASNST